MGTPAPAQVLSLVAHPAEPNAHFGTVQRTSGLALWPDGQWLPPSIPLPDGFERVMLRVFPAAEAGVAWFEAVDREKVSGRAGGP